MSLLHAADASGLPETKLIHNLCVGKHDSIYQRLKSSAEQRRPEPALPGVAPSCPGEPPSP